MSNRDPTLWDPPQYLAISDRKFLVDRAQTLHHIEDERNIKMGLVLYQVRQHFSKDSKLNGWWQRWIEEATPLSVHEANDCIAIWKCVREVPDAEQTFKEYTRTSSALIARLPPKVRSQLIDVLNNSEQQLTQQQLNAVASSPEVELEKAEVAVQELQSNLAAISLKVATAKDSTTKSNATNSKARTKDRLELALQKLSEARSKVNSLEKTRSTQELVVAQLQAQLRNQQLKLEEMQMDPVAKRKRAVAKTIVNASNGLDLLLETLDKYQVDKDEIGPEALSTIERKMAQVKAKLMEVKIGSL